MRVDFQLTDRDKAYSRFFCELRGEKTARPALRRTRNNQRRLVANIAASRGILSIGGLQGHGLVLPKRGDARINFAGLAFLSLSLSLSLKFDRHA